MTQVTDLPSRARCRELLTAAPAFGAFRRAVHRTAPPEARGWLGALGVLVRRPDGLRASQVAELLHIDLSVASRHLTQLEALGYVAREPDPADRRASVVRATPEGIAWIEAFADDFAGQMRGWLVGWSDEDVAAFTTFLHRFGARLEEASP